jgi:hypothetical protein
MASSAGDFDSHIWTMVTQMEYKVGLLLAIFTFVISYFWFECVECYVTTFWGGR